MAPHSGIYNPLYPERSHIRLVIIHPQDEVSEQIKCDLETHALDEQLDYEALSYVWGDEGHDKEILLNSQAFPVRRNLAFALEDLRLADRSRRLWIDAICINQGDLEERSSQVLLMRHIYRYASRVVVWLGISTPENVSAFNLLKYVNEMVQPNGIMDRSEPPSQSVLAKLWNYLSTDISAKEALSYLYCDLLMQAWWRRVWVIQEVAVSSKATVVIGDSEFDWPSLHDTISIIIMTGAQPTRFASPTVLGSSLRSLWNIEILRKCVEQGSLPSISTLVARSRQAATDPRDLIYAFLGLARESNDPLLTPNYSDSNPALDVFINLIEYSMQVENSLDIVCSSQGRIPNDLPSWCLDWTKPRSVGLDYGSDFSSSTPAPLIPSHGISLIDNPWHACGDKSPIARIIRSPLTLACKGLLVDVVEVVGNPIEFNLSKQPWNRILINLYRWESLILNHFSGLKSRVAQTADGPSILDVSDQYHRIMFSFTDSLMLGLTGTPNSGSWARKGPMILRSLRAMGKLTYSSYRILQKLRRKPVVFFRGLRFQYITGGPLAEAYMRTLITNRVGAGDIMTDSGYRSFWSKVPKSLNNPAAPSPAPFLRVIASNMMDNIHARTLVITQKGYLGLGPTMARQGDLVCVLYGCSVPVIIRKYGQGCRFVDESYVHGLMDGAAVNQQSLRDTLEEREFVLE